MFKRTTIFRLFQVIFQFIVNLKDQPEKIWTTPHENIENGVIFRLLRNEKFSFTSDDNYWFLTGTFDYYEFEVNEELSDSLFDYFYWGTLEQKPKIEKSDFKVRKFNYNGEIIKINKNDYDGKLNIFASSNFQGRLQGEKYLCIELDIEKNNSIINQTLFVVYFEGKSFIKTQFRNTIRYHYDDFLDIFKIVEEKVDKEVVDLSKPCSIKENLSIKWEIYSNLEKELQVQESFKNRMKNFAEYFAFILIILCIVLSIFFFIWRKRNQKRNYRNEDIIDLGDN
eukprot:TRINITY_DN3529_c0_g1_i1.p1 TRINITY_DN3529_c0_g1~~TRINITY_DN3529_c0_g1_i1.p1  ORF type:complete len:282 (-),score=-26.45 TRINITY_DN3529_c0_g1_i1:14-859(-)